MPRILTELKLDEFEFLSTVDKGASGDEENRPRITLFKRDMDDEDKRTRPDRKESELGQFLSERMEERGITAAQLGQASGIDADTVEGIVGGEIVRPPPERLAGFARALGTSVRQLESLIPEETATSPSKIKAKDKIMAILDRFRKQEDEAAPDSLEEILAKLPESERKVVLAALEASAVKEGDEDPIEDKADDEDPNPEDKMDEDHKPKMDEEHEDKAEDDEDEEDEEKLKMSKAFEKKLNEANAKIAKLETQNRLAEFEKYAEDSLATLPGKSSQEVGALLEKCDRVLTKAEYKDLAKSLESAAQAVSESAMFKTYGSGRPDPGSAAEQIENLAKEYVKDNPKTTMAVAKLELSSTHTALFKKARQEERA